MIAKITGPWVYGGASGKHADARFERRDCRKIWSTNPLGRLNKEIKRRTDAEGHAGALISHHSAGHGTNAAALGVEEYRSGSPTGP
ncbi:MAG TPA: transposase, partial [Acidimicrobiales bacterium]|nr:transposase [Acidimicrobiales bacterium]